jgi:hypothetical protein
MDLLQKIFWPHSVVVTTRSLVVTTRSLSQHLVWSVNFCNRARQLNHAFACDISAFSIHSTTNAATSIHSGSLCIS